MKNKKQIEKQLETGCEKELEILRMYKELDNADMEHDQKALHLIQGKISALEWVLN